MTGSAAARFLAAIAAVGATATLPAVAGAAPVAAQTSVIRDCLSRPATKPSSITLACADANARLVGIVWDSWTADIATGVGDLEENTCEPDCARGAQVSRRVGISVHTPVGTGADRRFTVVTYGTSGAWGNDFRDADLPR
ncbi:hypothetical protein FK268_02500 [Tsukamurella sputi]|uniref:Secreted protein n=1 Tax=Tsukamurella sputi TaxID=2591848 RepID=A0A5C5RSR9_9ACTN|nr:hypothetical protein [Tsukamurella sputi]TWS26136.1 hypothetical protein FK268_02500 [Tsukamurella sputi]